MYSTKGAASKLFVLGIFALVYAWVVIVVAAALNPWFVFTSNAFSDLGAGSSTDPWLFNYGMMSVGALIVVYSYSLTSLSENRTEVVGSSFFLISGIFLVLIGYFHEGTYPHLFVSYWFFIQSDLAILVWGLGLMIRGRRNLGTVFAALGIVSPIVAVVVNWPSTATVEAFGIAVIDAWTVLMVISVWRGNR